MPRMIELMRQSAVPANVMRSAARGALALPPPEMIEILVYLTTNPVFAEQAKMTLAGWEEASSILVAGDPSTPKEVLDYLVDPQNRRPRLIPELIENPSVEEKHLLDMAQAESRELVDMMLASKRVRKSPHVLHALATNPHLNPDEAQKVQQALLDLGEDVAAVPAGAAETVTAADDEETAKYLAEHAAEIAAEEGKAFELVGAHESHEEVAAIAAVTGQAPAASATAPAAAATTSPAAVAEPAAAAAPAAKAVPQERERISVIQKIARLTVGERVQLAMKGTKDERFVLIRDGSKVVSSAVLESPKVSDAEIEQFAAMKNVQESVLRGITQKRKFMKNYGVIRALINNPRVPIDLGLGLMNHLLLNDLKALSMNKNVSDTLRKLALKTYKQKSAPPGSKHSE